MYLPRLTTGEKLPINYKRRILSAHPCGSKKWLGWERRSADPPNVKGSVPRSKRAAHWPATVTQQTLIKHLLCAHTRIQHQWHRSGQDIHGPCSHGAEVLTGQTAMNNDNGNLVICSGTRCTHAHTAWENLTRLCQNLRGLGHFPFLRLSVYSQLKPSSAPSEALGAEPSPFPGPPVIPQFSVHFSTHSASFLTLSFRAVYLKPIEIQWCKKDTS